MASPYAAQLSRLSNLQGASMSADYNRDQAAQNLAKLEYQTELDRQRKAQKKAKQKHEGDWWKRGLGSAAAGAITGAIAGLPAGGIGALPGAMAGAAAGFAGSTINEKLMGGALGDGFGMQLGGSVGGAVGGHMVNQQNQLGLPSARLEDLNDAVLSDPAYANYKGYTSLGGNVDPMGGGQMPHSYYGASSAGGGPDQDEAFKRMWYRANRHYWDIANQPSRPAGDDFYGA